MLGTAQKKLITTDILKNANRNYFYIFSLRFHQIYIFLCDIVANVCIYRCFSFCTSCIGKHQSSCTSCVTGYIFRVNVSFTKSSKLYKIFNFFIRICMFLCVQTADVRVWRRVWRKNRYVCRPMRRSRWILQRDAR